MRILVIGSGGREHALCWKLAQEAEVHCAPGNPGIAEDVTCHAVSVSDLAGLVSLAKSLVADLVVVGPENPLIDGLGDLLRAAGVPCFGPSADAARLEGSKAFSKDLMRKAGVPTAEFESFTSSELARKYARSFFDRGRRVVVKASGAALGKGVIVCDKYDEAERAIVQMIDESEFGAAGSTVVVEERLSGPEFSLLTLCSDDKFVSLPVAQDYKRAGDGDTGLNTGGMGSYSPVPSIPSSLVSQTEEECVRPILKALPGYRGVLFSGLMVCEGRAYCLEYNVRFGDPETQSVMMRLGSGFADALMACARGDAIPSFEVLDRAAVCVVMASAGYPGSVKKGVEISLPPSVDPSAKLFHAGTSLSDGKVVTSGGRVFGATACGSTLEEARARAYELATSVQFDGGWFRTDIADIAETVRS